MAGLTAELRGAAAQLNTEQTDLTERLTEQEASYLERSAEQKVGRENRLAEPHEEPKTTTRTSVQMK